MTSDSAFPMAGEAMGEAIDPERVRSHELGLNGMIAGGVLQFQLDYSRLHYEEQDMAALGRHIAQGLRAVIEHCLETGSGDFTPSDFPLATVDQSTLDEWQRRYAIAALYPATAMQQGMLFHGLLDREAYITQLYPTLRGTLELPLLRQAWQAIVDRHSIFRTIFAGDGEQPHQLVLKQATLPWHEEDWRELAAIEQESRFEEYRRADKARGFDVTEAPLMRLSVFRLGESRYPLLWTPHHRLPDGSCIPLVYRDVIAAYTPLLQKQAASLPAAPVYARYIQRLLKQNKEEAGPYR